MKTPAVLCCAVGLLVAIRSSAAEDDLSASSSLDPAGVKQLVSAMDGEPLEPEDVAKLKVRLAANPRDVAARLRLLGDTDSDRTDDETRTLILGFVEQHARDRVGDFAGVLAAVAASDPETWRAASAAWRRLVAASPVDATVAGNAGVFLTTKGRPESDVAEGLRLLLRAHAMQREEPRWLVRLADHSSDLAPADRHEVLGALLASLPAPEARKRRLGGTLLAEHTARAAWAAGDRAGAKKGAIELLGWASRASLRWDHGNVVHHMNILLGKIALAEGDLDSAKSHLFAAGATPTSPQLSTFGPDWSLAKALLDRGERAAVFHYVDLCDGFWESGRERLARWRTAIAAGRPVDFPPSRYDAAPSSAKPAAQPSELVPSSGPDRLVPGLWESASTSKGGIGHAFELRDGGEYRSSTVAIVDMRYEVSGERLSFASPGEKLEPIPLGRFAGDTWTIAQGVAGTVEKKRAAGGPADASPIVGIWSYAHYTGPTAYERYTADGHLSFRLPMAGADAGRWALEAGRLRVDVDGEESRVYRVTVRDGMLTMTNDDGKAYEYRWAGEKAWYRF